MIFQEQDRMTKRAAQTELSSDKLKRIALGGKLKDIEQRDYDEMVRVVERAMEPGSDQPIVFDVRQRYQEPGYVNDFDLVLYPENRENALYLLQKLRVTNGEKHNNLTNALYDDEGLQWRAYLSEAGTSSSSDSEDEDKRKRKQADQQRARHAWQNEALLKCGVPPVGRIYPKPHKGLSPWLYSIICFSDLKEEDDEDF